MPASQSGMKENQHIEYKQVWHDDYLKLLGKHPSCPFNPLLANAFFRAGYIESWGRGIEKIHRECREHGIEPPVYDFGMAGLLLTFRANPAHLQVAALKLPGETTQKTTQKILQILVRNHSFSRREIADALGNVSENGVKYHLERLKASGHIRRVGPDKGGRWEVLK
jgi:ATP-dependent DNA helicase RecG